MRRIRGAYLLGLALLLMSRFVSAETPLVGGERCFGAAGDNCAVRNGTVQEGYCIGTKCPVSGGSWEHDECCWKKTVDKKSGKSCIAPAPGMSAGSGPAQVCNTEWVKALQRTAGGWNWWRTVDTSLLNSTGKVVFNQYCAETGSRVHEKDVKYCCSKRAYAPSSPDVAEARICR
jgi:hypothetical protein